MVRAVVIGSAIVTALEKLDLKFRRSTKRPERIQAGAQGAGGRGKGSAVKKAVAAKAAANSGVFHRSFLGRQSRVARARDQMLIDRPEGSDPNIHRN